MTEHIEFCPLCGNEADVIEPNSSIDCNKCRLQVVHQHGLDIAIETWNNQKEMRKYTGDELNSMDILPCPFCGENDQFDLQFFKTIGKNRLVKGSIECACGMRWYDDYYYPAQYDSHHRLTTKQTEKEIIKTWNKKVYDYWVS